MSPTSFDLCVIGAGPGGYVAAIRGAQAGLSVVCIDERPTLGGTCLNVGCIPSKALLESSELYSKAKNDFADHGLIVEGIRVDMAKFLERKNKIVKQLTLGVASLFKKHKITSKTGRARLMAPGEVEVTFDGKSETIIASKIVVATGSTPSGLPQLPFDGDRIIDSTAALELSAVPATLTVIGGGYIGLELGSVFARLGTKVTIVEALPRLVPMIDKEAGDALMRSLKKQGLQFLLDHKLVSGKVGKDAVELSLTTSDGKTASLSSEKVLVCVGRRPNTQGLGLDAVGVKTDEKGRVEVDAAYQTGVSGIYAIGDVIRGPMLAHKASEEGIAVIEKMSGKKPEVNYALIPSVIYTSPEVATVGLNEEEAKAQGLSVKTAKFPFMANGRSLAHGNKEGFVKLVAEEGSNRLLGATIIGPNASELIAEITLALEYGASAEDIALTIHAHPTLAEAVHEAALNLSGNPLHF